MESNILLYGENQIKIGDLSASIEDFSGKRKFYLESELSGILDYEKRMITESKFPEMLPINFLMIGNKERVYYDFTGYIQLSLYIKHKCLIVINKDNFNMIQEALEIIIKFLNAVKSKEDYLLSLDHIPFITDAIFINPSTGSIAIVYIPSICSSDTIQYKVIALIKSLDSLYNNVNISLYLVSLVETIYDKNLGLDGIINTLGIILREVSYSQWTKHEFRELKEEIENNSINEEENQNKNKSNIFLNYGNVLKLSIVQIILFIILIGIYSIEIIELTDFMGLCAIALGIDIWILRSTKQITIPKQS